MQKYKNKIAIILVALLLIIAIGNGASKQINATKETEDIENKASDYQASQHEEQLSEAVYMAPDFKLQSLNGETVRLSDYAGKKVLLNFWATWCPPCNEEAPHLQTIYESYQSAGVEILAVNVTNEDKNHDKIEQFVQQYALTFPTLLDQSGEVSAKYRILTLPTTYFIDEEGAIFETITGPMDDLFIHDLLYKMDNE